MTDAHFYLDKGELSDIKNKLTMVCEIGRRKGDIHGRKYKKRNKKSY